MEFTDFVHVDVIQPDEVEYRAAGTYHPALVVGLGGTGAGVLKRVKRLMSERHGKSVQFITYLAIDSDARTFAGGDGLPAFETSEQCDITMQPGEAAKFVRDMKRGFHPELKRWMSPDLLTSHLKGDGAGTIRQCGRFSLWTHFAEVQRALQQTAARVASIPDLVAAGTSLPDGCTIDPDPTIYVVSSCCGGTGAGTFLDIALLLRDAFPGRTPHIVGMLTLPSVYDDKTAASIRQRNRLRANAVASLLELQVFCDDQELSSGDWGVVYPGKLTITPKEPIFDQVYIVEGRNERNLGLRGMEEVFELMARALVQDIGSPLGQAAASRAADLEAGGLAHPDASTGRRRFLHSLSVSSLVLPARELVTYCALRKSIETLNALLGCRHESITEASRAFLSSIKLNEYGPSNQLLDLLRLRPSGVGQPPESLDGSSFELKSVSKRSAADVLAEQQALLGGIGDGRGARDEKEIGAEAFARTVVVAQAQRNRRILCGEDPASKADEELGIEDVKRKILAKIETVLLSDGVSAARQWLAQLDADFLAMAKELRDESADWNRDDWRNGIAGLRARASSIFVQPQSLENLAARHNDVVRGLALEAVRSEAVILLDELRSWMVSEMDTPLANCQKELLSSVKAYQDRLSRLEKARSSDTNPSLYTLERIVFSLEDYRKQYEHLSKGLKCGLSDLAGSAEGTLLDQLRSKPSAVAGSLLDMAARAYGNRVREMNVIHAVDGSKSLTRHLNTMFGYCSPFWQMIEQGDQAFQQSVLVGVPIPVGDADPDRDAIIEQVSRWVKDHTTADSVDPPIVHTNYPFSFEMMVRVYGARPYYHTEWPYWLRHYEDLLPAPTMPLHLDKAYAMTLPRMAPLDPGEVAFAIGIAFGFIAVGGTGKYYFGIRRSSTSGGIPTPQFKSLLAVVSLETRGATRVSSKYDTDAMFFSGPRADAMRTFVHREDDIDELQAALSDMAERKPKQYAKALGKHHASLLKLAKARVAKDPNLAQQLRHEADCIELALRELEMH